MFNSHIFPFVTPFKFNCPIGQIPTPDNRAIPLIKAHLIVDLANIINEYCQVEMKELGSEVRYSIFDRCVLEISIPIYDLLEEYYKVCPLEDIRDNVNNVECYRKYFHYESDHYSLYFIYISHESMRQFEAIENDNNILEVAFLLEQKALNAHSVRMTKNQCLGKSSPVTQCTWKSYFLEILLS